MKVFVSLAFLFVLLASQRVSAQTDSNAFRQSWNQGLDAFNLGKYDEAWVHFERSRKHAPDKPGPYRYLARTGRALGKWHECVQNGVRAISLNPDSRYAPEVVADINHCRAQMGRPEMIETIPKGQGALAIISNVEGASVEVDGIKKGATPMSPFAILPGKHQIHLERRGYFAVDLEVEVVPGIVVDVEADLSADPNYSDDSAPEIPDKPDVKVGWLIVNVNLKDGVTYKLDGKVIVPAPNGEIEAEPGAHALEIEANGYVPWRRRVVFVRGQKRSISLDLKAVVDRKRERRNAYIALGVASVAGISGVVFGALENSNFDKAYDAADIERLRPVAANVPAGLPESKITSRQELEEMHDKGKRLGLISNISYGVAAGAFAVGLYYLVQERSEERQGYAFPIALVPTFDPTGGAGVQLLYKKELNF